ncbi:hypothetical protein D9M71_521210 [compost metagenome]
MPGGSRGQLVSFEKNDVSPTEFGKVVGNAGTHGAAADDDRAGMGGKGARHVGSPVNKLPFSFMNDKGKLFTWQILIVSLLTP